MGKAELMQEKIAKQRQLPTEIKDKLNGITFSNLLVAIAINIYMIAVNLLFMNQTAEIFSNIVKASAITFAIIDVIIFEIGYRKDSVTLWVYGVELLFFSLFILAIPYIYIYFPETVRKIIMFAPVYFSIYYVGKAIVIHIVETKKYINNLSDVFEILQDDTENQSYIEDIEIDKENDND